MDTRDIEHQAEQAPWAGRNEVYLPHDPIQLDHFRKGPQPPRRDAYDDLPLIPPRWLMLLAGFLFCLGFWWGVIYLFSK